MTTPNAVPVSPDCDSELSAVPRHIAIIMDGNGRWAARRGLPRLAGHRAGVNNVRRLLKACVQRHIRFLTLYAFSTENWSRPRDEVNGLMGLLSEFIDSETRALDEAGVQIRHLGKLDGLPEMLQRKVREATRRTEYNSTLTVAVALNYGGRAEIVDAVRAMVASGVPSSEIDERKVADHLTTRGLPDPDLVIRTSGESRLSNFLIWQTAYSEYWSTDVCWPDFGPDDLERALQDYATRQRRFGGLGSTDSARAVAIGAGAQ